MSINDFPSHLLAEISRWVVRLQGRPERSPRGSIVYAHIPPGEAQDPWNLAAVSQLWNPGLLYALDKHLSQKTPMRHT